MNLPHLPPLIFAKKVVSLNKNEATVFCDFNITPTLCMFIEAFAQSSLAFNTNNQIKIGFLTKANKIKLLNNIDENSFLIKIQKIAEVANIKQFYIEAYGKKSGKKTVSGDITLFLKK
jgi:hypothetical protein